MDAGWPDGTEPEKTDGTTRFFGFSLVLGGALVAAWLLYTVYLLLQGSSPIRIFGGIIPMEELERTIESSSGAVVLPDSLYYVFGYVIVVVLLILCAGIASTLIKTGARLLRPDYGDSLKKLKGEIRASKEKKDR